MSKYLENLYDLLFKLYSFLLDRISNKTVCVYNNDNTTTTTRTRTMTVTQEKDEERHINNPLLRTPTQTLDIK